ncbi:MAG: Hpt domain-containing protein [Bdellovibrionales bacterium]
MAAYDQEAFHSLIDGDQDLFAELYQLYSTDWPQLLKGIEDAQKAGQAPEVERLAHRLKGMTRNFFATSTADLCGEVEELARVQNLKDIPQHLGPLYKSLQQLDDELRENLKI